MSKLELALQYFKVIEAWRPHVTFNHLLDSHLREIRMSEGDVLRYLSVGGRHPGTQGPAFPGQTFCGTHGVDGSRNDLEPEWVCAGQDHHVRAHLLSFPSQMYATLYIIVVASRSRVWIWIKYLEPVRTLRPLRLLSSNS